MERKFYLTQEKGRNVLRTAEEITAKGGGYYRRSGNPAAPESRLYVPTGNPAQDEGALLFGGASGKKPFWQGRTLTPPVPVESVNWRSAPVILSGSGDISIPAGNYRNDDPSKSLFAVPGDRKVYFENSRMLSAGAITDGFNHRIHFNNCRIQTMPPTVAGKSAPRLIRGKEVKKLVIENCTIPYAGLGIIISGQNKRFKGDYTIGDGVFFRRNRVRGVDGRRSNGQGGYYKSSIGEAHYSSGHPEGANIRNNGGIIGFEIANVLQLLQCSGTPFEYSDNEILSDLGNVHEDMFNFYGGSGARAEAQGLITRNLIELTSRWDWRNTTLAPGTSFQHDGMIKDGSDGYQAAGDFTKSSDTGIILGDNSNTDAYANNTAYITVLENWILGTRTTLNIHSGHHLSIIRNRLYPTDRHRTGVLYTGQQYVNYEMYDGTDNSGAANNNGARAVDKPGETIWGHHVFQDNEIYQGTATTTGGYPGDMILNGGTANGILYKPRITDGGIGLIESWNGTQQSAGRIIGSTLTAIPI